MRRSPVITGLGVLSSAGSSIPEFRTHIAAGTCCLSPIRGTDAPSLRSRFAGLLPESEAPRLAPAAGLESLDRFVHIALAAAREALADARVRPAELGPRMGLVLATCSGPMLLIEAHYERILRGTPAITPEQLFAKRYYSGAKALAHALGVQGLSTTVVTACSAGTAAVALAADLVHSGLLDLALAGGSDAFATSTLAGFEGLKATCDARCAPFSKPLGLNLGEGAGFVVVETPESATKRSARIHARVLGSGLSNDAYHCSAPEPAGRGLANAMRRALADAGLEPDHIRYINAHGTGTEANDKAEVRAIRRVFGSRAGHLPVSSTKSMIGHCLGAAGTIEILASVVCAQTGVFPPTANFTGPRDGCDLDCIPDSGRPWESPRVFMSNNSAFGGHNASIILATPESAPESRPAPAPSNPNSPANVAQPIWVTACGLVSPAGLGADAVRAARSSGRSGIAPVSVPGLPPLLAGRVDEAAVDHFDRRLDLRGLDRSSRWAIVAALLAIREARFPQKPSALAELGIFLHLSAGPSWAESEFLTSFLGHHRQIQQLGAFPYIVPSSVAGNVCRALMLAGHNLTLSAGPGAGLLGLVPAVAALRAGHAPALLTGAVDELSDRILADQCLTGLLDEPDATPPGEGAAVLMLEPREHALARGVAPLAELRSIVASTEIQHAASADNSTHALQETIHLALHQAELTPEQIDLVCSDASRARQDAVTAALCPSWKHRCRSSAPCTGRMEGAQILADLHAAWHEDIPTPQNPHHVLAFVSSPQGTNAAAVFKRIENIPPRR